MLMTDKRLVKLQKRTEKQGRPFISPFLREAIRDNVLSYGLSSCGYDARLANTFKIPKADVLDPKNLSESDFESVETDQLVIPPGTFVLGTTVERFHMPENLFALCVGKSTYARCGIIVNVTPIEPGWQGYITVEISNTYWKDARVYANEGIMQLMFISAGKRPLRTYCDKNGKYQNQPFEPVIPRM